MRIADPAKVRNGIHESDVRNGRLTRIFGDGVVAQSVHSGVGQQY